MSTNYKRFKEQYFTVKSLLSTGTGKHRGILKLESSTRRSLVGGYTTDKYYIDCDELPKSLVETTVERTTKGEIAIIKGILQESQTFPEREVVVKISSNADITQKEYNISEKLKNIPGFIRFICVTSCNDDLNRYRETVSITVCNDDSASSSKLHHLLVMPYFRLGSFEEYPWEEQPVEIFKSCLKQVIFSLASAYLQYGFIHLDIHMKNVMLTPTKELHIVYQSIDNYRVETHGLKIVIIDFDKSFTDLHGQDKAFFIDLLRVFNEIQTTIKLTFPQQYLVSQFLGSLTSDTNIVDAIKHISTIIDDIQSIGKVKIDWSKMTYNPNL